MIPSCSNDTRPRATVSWHPGRAAAAGGVTGAAGRVAPQRGAARRDAVGALGHSAVAVAGGGWRVDPGP